jgi:hypothetical protein
MINGPDVFGEKVNGPEDYGKLECGCVLLE